MKVVIPKDQRSIVIVPSYNVKADKRNCKNHRGKVQKLIGKRYMMEFQLKEKVEGLNAQQEGATRGCTDKNLTLKQMSDKMRKQTEF